MTQKRNGPSAFFSGGAAVSGALRFIQAAETAAFPGEGMRALPLALVTQRSRGAEERRGELVEFGFGASSANTLRLCASAPPCTEPLPSGPRISRDVSLAHANIEGLRAEHEVVFVAWLCSCANASRMAVTWVDSGKR
jgi:hypothetical protein